MRPANQPRSSSMLVSFIASSPLQSITGLHHYTSIAGRDKGRSRIVRPCLPPSVRSQSEELPAWFEAFGTAFYIWATDPHAAAAFRGPNMDLQRCLGAFEGDHDRRHVPLVPDAADGPRRRAPRGRCGLRGERSPDASPAGHPDPDDHRGSLAVRGPRRGRVDPHRRGMADLRPLRLRARDVAGEVDAAHAGHLVPRTAGRDGSRSWMRSRRASSCPRSTTRT